jgi:hypothetical protein
MLSLLRIIISKWCYIAPNIFRYFTMLAWPTSCIVSILRILYNQNNFEINRLYTTRSAKKWCHFVIHFYYSESNGCILMYFRLFNLYYTGVMACIVIKWLRQKGFFGHNSSSAKSILLKEHFNTFYEAFQVKFYIKLNYIKSNLTKCKITYNLLYIFRKSIVAKC